MSSIYYLNTNDFIQDGQNLVLANLDGLTFVMFHTQRCQHCTKFLPEFKQLPGSIRGVNYGLCNVEGTNKSIVQQSQSTTTPITGVPKFILYNNGIPAVEYTGQRSRMAVLAFIQDIIGKLNQKQSFTRPRRTRQDPQQMPVQQMPAQQMPSAPMGPSRPGGQSSMGAPRQAAPSDNNDTYKITPSTGVKEYATSYGRPYNTANEAEFLEYERAYQAMHNKGN
jgi:hypothetical protein